MVCIILILSTVNPCPLAAQAAAEDAFDSDHVVFQTKEGGIPYASPNLLSEVPLHVVVGLDRYRGLDLLGPDGESLRVALLGVTPHSDRSLDRGLSRAALEWALTNLVSGHRVMIQWDPAYPEVPRTDRMAYVYRHPDGLMINLELVRQGMAKSQGGVPYKYRDAFDRAAREAREHKRGLWSPQAGGLFAAHDSADAPTRAGTPALPAPTAEPIPGSGEPASQSVPPHLRFRVNDLAPHLSIAVHTRYEEDLTRLRGRYGHLQVKEYGTGDVACRDPEPRPRGKVYDPVLNRNRPLQPYESRQSLCDALNEMVEYLKAERDAIQAHYQQELAQLRLRRSSTQESTLPPSCCFRNQTASGKRSSSTSGGSHSRSTTWSSWLPRNSSRCIWTARAKNCLGTTAENATTSSAWCPYRSSGSTLKAVTCTGHA